MAGHGSVVESQILPVPGGSESYWRSELHPIDGLRSTEELPSECDIAIIGAGMSGVATAYHLIQQYGNEAIPRIVLLDARQLCSGATGRNGGHIKCPTPTILRFQRDYGVAAADEIATFVQDHIQAIKDTVEKEVLDCEFELRRSFDVFLDPTEGRDVQNAFKESLKNGQAWTRTVTVVPEPHVEEITSVKGAQAALSVPACSLWPYKFVSQLLSRIADRINVQMGTPVTEILSEPESSLQTLCTHRGNIRARKIVLASNAYTAGIVPSMKGKIIPTRAYATHLARNSIFRAPHLSNTYNIKYAGKGTDYLNPRPDGGIVVGGAKWTFDDDPKSWFNVWDDAHVSDRPREHFEHLMQNYFVGWERSGAQLDILWCGITGTTPDTLPYIGQVPGMEGKQYIIAGFNGGGMPLIFLSALGLAKILKSNIPFSESGIPSLFEVTAQRLANA